MAIQQDWHIQSRGTACAETGRAFGEEEKIVSALFWRDGQYERIDFSEEGWSQRNDNIAPVSHWRHKFITPPPPPPEPLRKDDAESMLKHLLEQDEADKRNVCYILALMLERKRLLRPIDKQTGEEGTPILVYEHLASGDTWIVHDPQLKLDEIGPVQDEVVKLLDEGLIVGEAPAEDGDSCPAPAEENDEAVSDGDDLDAEQAPAEGEDVSGDDNDPAPEREGETEETPQEDPAGQKVEGMEPDDNVEELPEEDPEEERKDA